MESLHRLINECKEMGSQILYDEAVYLYSLVVNTPFGHVVEIGSASGGTTNLLLHAAEESGKAVFSIDPYPLLGGVAREYNNNMIERLKGQFRTNVLSNGRWKGRITQINKDLPDCIGELPNNLSVVFIDGMHEFDYVERDFGLLSPKLIHNGAICIHDMHYKEGQLTKEGGLHRCVQLLVLNQSYKNVVTIVDTMMIGVKV